MNSLSREVRNIQNPALGAALLWRYSFGYRESHRVRDHAPFHLLFIVLPILLHEQTYELAKSTWRSSGLHAFVAKFATPKDARQDLLLALHNRIAAMKELTLESFRVAQRSKLLSLSRQGQVVCLTDAAASVGDADVKSLMKIASPVVVYEG